MKFTDQSPEALRLAVVEGDFNQGQFRRLVSDTLCWKGIEVETAIIGASHIVSFRTPNFRLHEVFACETPHGTSSRPLKELVGQPMIERFFSDMRYWFIAEQFDWQYPEPQPVLAIADAVRQKSEERLGLVFDFPAGELCAVPKTVVNVWPSHQGILVGTLHSYPEQGYVLSLSALLSIE